MLREWGANRLKIYVKGQHSVHTRSTSRGHLGSGSRLDVRDVRKAGTKKPHVRGSERLTTRLSELKCLFLATQKEFFNQLDHIPDPMISEKSGFEPHPHGRASEPTRDLEKAKDGIAQIA